MYFGYKQLYIDGKLQDASASSIQRQLCPATLQPVADLAWGSEVDANKALDAARKAFPSWSALSLDERTEWMMGLRDAVKAREEDLRMAVMHEMGKPWNATAEDFDTLVKSLRWYPQAMRQIEEISIADRENQFVHRMLSKPVGVVVALLAWNFPLLNVAFKLAPALAAGCTIVIKPSPMSALSAYLLAEIAASITFPPGVINIICGPDDSVGKTLSSSAIPRLLTMIGSSAVGRKLVAQGATSIKRMSMELGGNAPAMVFEDADLKKAAREIAALKFGNAGQICVSPNRILVQSVAMPEFINLLQQEADAIRIGFGRDSGATMGPLIDDAARRRVDGLVKEALAEGATLVRGGNKPLGVGPGYFYEPTILTDVTGDMRISREEIFGPVATVVAFESEDEVISIANDTAYGLVAFAYTKDEERILRLISRLEFGEIMINGYKWDIDLPHGGIKESGVGKDCSVLALDDYLVKIRVTVALNPSTAIKTDQEHSHGF